MKEAGMDYFVEATRGARELDRLSPREIEVALRVARGLTNREIAGELIVSFRTVDTHVANVMSKLCVGRRSQIATLVERAGLLASDDPDRFATGGEGSRRPIAGAGTYPSHGLL
jgi:DNA-binding NarL/FixJ family response regulator